MLMHRWTCYNPAGGESQGFEELSIQAAILASFGRANVCKDRTACSWCELRSGPERADSDPESGRARLS